MSAAVLAIYNLRLIVFLFDLFSGNCLHPVMKLTVAKCVCTTIYLTLGITLIF